ncbi:MAG TPA: hypothetical protein VNJ02_13035 [Vicinamibacterales bacterium]|nr:hypothetical protein [Vicinamibacterales bacterium]
MRAEPDVDGSARPIDAGAQDVLIYLYANDLEALRATLLANGVQASDISYPEYLPDGEFRTTDPDGYTLMIAQSRRGASVDLVYLDPPFNSTRV